MRSLLLRRSTRNLPRPSSDGLPLNSPRQRKPEAIVKMMRIDSESGQYFGARQVINVNQFLCLRCLLFLIALLFTPGLSAKATTAPPLAELPIVLWPDG